MLVCTINERALQTLWPAPSVYGSNNGGSFYDGDDCGGQIKGDCGVGHHALNGGDESNPAASLADF